MVPYKIAILKDRRFEQTFQLMLKKVYEDNSRVIYECDGDLWISPQSVGLDWEQFVRFYKRMRLEGGRKRLVQGQIHVFPARKRVVAVRLHDAEYALLKRIAPNNEPLPDFIRTLVFDTLRDYQYLKKRQVGKALPDEKTA